MYKVYLLDAAASDLAHLDRSVAQRIARRIQWLAENVEAIRPVALTGDLAGMCKLRVGDYRVIYEILHSEETLVVHMIGQHSEVYRKR